MSALTRSLGTPWGHNPRQWGCSFGGLETREWKKALRDINTTLKRGASALSAAHAAGLQVSLDVGAWTGEGVAVKGLTFPVETLRLLTKLNIVLWISVYPKAN